LRLGGSPFGDVAPDFYHLNQPPRAVQNRGSVDFFPGHRFVAAFALADPDLAPTRPQAGEGGAVGQIARPRSQFEAAATQNLLAGDGGSLQKCVIGSHNLSFRVEDYNPVIDTVDHGFQPLPLGTHFSNQARHRVCHGIELFGHPRQGVRTFRGYAPSEITLGNQARRGFKTLQTPQDRHPNHQGDGPDDDKGQGASAGYHPAQVARHRGAYLSGVVVQNQDAIDFLAGIVATVALIAVTNRHDGSQNRSTPRLDHAAGAAGFRRIAMAGLAGGRVDAEIISRGSRPTRVAFRAAAVQHHELFDARLFAEALDHLRN